MKKLMLATVALCAFTFPPAVMANTGNMPNAYLERALSALPHEKAENFRDTMQQAHEQNKQLYDEAHKLRQDMHQILTASSFDKDAFSTKSEQLMEIHDQIASNLDYAFVQAVSDLTVPERERLAAALEQSRKAARAAKKGQ